MKAALNTVDWIVCLAWSLGHATLTALVRRTAVNAAVTFDAILLGPRIGHGFAMLSTARESARRWVGRCAACRKAHRVDGVLARGRRGGCDEMVVVSGARVYRAADHGSNPTVLFVSCCDGRVKLQRVYDDARPGRERHECN